MKSKRKKRKLVDIDVAEVSLVDRPANRRAFYVVKNQGVDPEQAIDELLRDDDVLESVAEAAIGNLDNLDNPSDEELDEAVDQVIDTIAEAVGEVIEDVSDDESKSEALEVVDLYSDDLPAALVDAIEILSAEGQP